MKTVDDLPDQIRSKIAVQPDGCWLWTASTTTGYGRIRINYVEYKAHRVVYHLLRDPSLPMRPSRPSDHVDHLCRERSCVNPDHLEPGTCRTNVSRGRRSMLRDTASPYIGVVRVVDGTWHAQCQVDRKPRYFGRGAQVTCAHYIDAALMQLGERPPNHSEGLVDRLPNDAEMHHVAPRVERILRQREERAVA